ncbi:MAG: SMODS domain-containing nucleotidyltransferase [Salinispira sp.]
MKNINDFKKFMTTKVNLNQSRIDILNAKIKTIKAILSEKLRGYRKIEKQGSYALQTIIKPVQENDEFDADILVYMKKQHNWSASDYITAIFDIFSGDNNYRSIIRKKTRCITLDYKGDFHIDIVPAIEINSQIYICNSESNKLERTDGSGFRDWFLKKNETTSGQLKRVVRLFKFLRDHKKNFSAKSILVATVLGNVVDGSKEYPDIPSALKTLVCELDEFLQANKTMPIIANPAMPEEDFNRHWDQNKYSNFRDKVHIYYQKILQAFEEEDKDSSIRMWRKIFGDSFGSIIGTSNRNTVKIPPQKPYANSDFLQKIHEY